MSNYTGWERMSISPPTPILGCVVLGGFFKREGGKRWWYPQRLMCYTSDGIYEAVPQELSVPVLPNMVKKKKVA